MTTAGKHLGRYTVRTVLGRGRFATVYRAWDPFLEREVALKVLSEHLQADAAVRARFVSEARRLARCRHPHIVAVHDFGESAEQAFFVTDMVASHALTDLISEAQPVPVARAAALLSGLCAALDYLHGQGIVHGDVSPANVLLDDVGNAMLTDLGASWLFHGVSQLPPDARMTTPLYAAPEHLLGAALGPAADIYALGVLTYHLLAGRPPFRGETAHLLFAHAYEPPPPLERLRPGLPAAVYAVIAAALAKDPAHRPATAAALVDAFAGASGPPCATTTEPVTVQAPAYTLALRAPGLPGTDLRFSVDVDRIVIARGETFELRLDRSAGGKRGDIC